MSELDKIKTSITVSMGFKNRLKKLKGSESYEGFIGRILRVGNDVVGENRVELVKFERQQLVNTFEGFKVVFSFNKFNRSSNFQFDIAINDIREPIKGAHASIEDLYNHVQKTYNNSDVAFSIKKGYELYFELLAQAIKNAVEPLFKHKGRFEDYYQWMTEFSTLGLPVGAYDEDVKEKLDNYEAGLLFK
jgi:hypothetical protein